jgi:hypothetical protein
MVGRGGLRARDIAESLGATWPHSECAAPRQISAFVSQAGNTLGAPIPFRDGERFGRLSQGIREAERFINKPRSEAPVLRSLLLQSVPSRSCHGDEVIARLTPDRRDRYVLE